MKNILLTSTWMLLFICQITFANNSSTLTTPQDYINLANQVETKNVESAKQALTKALDLLNQTPNKELEFKVLIKHAIIAKNLKNYTASESYLNQAKSLRNIVNYQLLDERITPTDSSLDFNLLLADVDLFQLEAQLLCSQGKFDEASHLLEDALSVVENTGNNPALLHRVFHMKGDVFFEAGQYESALTSYLLAQQHAYMHPSHKRIKLWKDIAFIYSKLNDNYSAIRYYSRALNLLEKDNNLPKQAKILLDISRSYKKAGSFKEALTFGSQALTIAKATQNEEFTLKSLVHLSIIYRRLSSYESALEYGIEALQIYIKNNNLNGMASSFNAIGLIYKNLDHRDKAKIYFEKVMSLPKNKIEPKYYAAALRELALYHFYQKDYSAALTLNEHAYQIYEQIHDLKGKSTVKKNEGLIYQAIGNINLAFEAFNFGYTTSVESGDAWEQATNLANIAFLYANHAPEKTKTWAEKSLRIATRIQAKSVIEKTYLALSISEEKMQNYQQALAYAKLQAQTLNEIKTDTISTHADKVSALQNIIDKMTEIQSLKGDIKLMSNEFLKQNNEFVQLKEKSQSDDDLIGKLQIIILVLLTLALFFISKLQKATKG